MSVRLTRAELEQFNGATLPDLLGDSVRLLFVGINPGLLTAAVSAHFARKGNRFWPALYQGGVLPRLVDASTGMRADDLAMVNEMGIGITNLVDGASARADELTREQLRAGAKRLVETVRRVQPRVVAMLGVTSYREAFERKTAVTGRQDHDLGGAELWVLPNPSGLNAHETLDSLAAAYRRAAIAAGIEVGPPP